jgi:hypothetical protein
MIAVLPGQHSEETGDPDHQGLMNQSAVPQMIELKNVSMRSHHW